MMFTEEHQTTEHILQRQMTTWPWEIPKGPVLFGRNSKAPTLSSVSFASSLSNNQQGHPTFFQLCSYVSKVTGNKGGPVCLLYNKKKPQSCPFVNFDSKSICLKHQVSRCSSSERLRTGRYIRQDETSAAGSCPLLQTLAGGLSSMLMLISVLCPLQTSKRLQVQIED